MRRLPGPTLILITLLAAAGCGGGGGGGNEGGEQEVVLAVWPFLEDSEGSALVDSVILGFTGPRASRSDDEPVFLGEVLDGAEGLQARIDAAAGGPPFFEQVDRLTDGHDTILAVRAEIGTGGGAVSLPESQGLTLLVPAGPDLAGSRITAFQLDLTTASIVQGPLVFSPGREGTRVFIRGEVRILGIAANPD